MSERASTKGRVDPVVDQASRLMAAGWRGNPNMSGDDRDFMTPSMRRRHDDKARDIVEFVLAATGWQPLSTVPEDEWLLVATTGGWVGEAMVLDGVWKWASGNAFHSDIVPQKWMPLPGHPDNPASALSSQSLSLSEAREEIERLKGLVAGPQEPQDDEGDDHEECGLADDGFCTLSGTEYCDWDCPNNGPRNAKRIASMKATASVCEVCGGDCAGANPPPMYCPSRDGDAP